MGKIKVEIKKAQVKNGEGEVKIKITPKSIIKAKINSKTKSSIIIKIKKITIIKNKTPAKTTNKSN